MVGWRFCGTSPRKRCETTRNNPKTHAPVKEETAEDAESADELITDPREH